MGFFKHKALQEAMDKAAKNKNESPKSTTETQELLGGPYDPGGFSGGDAAEAAGLFNPTADLLETTAAATAPVAPSMVDEPFPGVTPGINPVDDSQGGANIEDPGAAAAAAASGLANNEPDETMTVTANAEVDIRPFQDQDFLLMQMYNLVNLRNEKENFELEEPPADKLEDVDGDKKPDNVALNAIRSIKGPLPYAYIAEGGRKETNAVIQCVADPGGFTNYLKGTPNVQQHLDMSTAELSNLTTKIRLYKLFLRDKEEEIVEFMFETSGIGASELEELTKSKGKKRGYGVGIKSFNFVNHNRYLHLIERTVTADLVIYADSIGSLLQTRTGTGPAEDLEYRFMDLAQTSRRSPGTISGSRKGSIDDLTFQVMIEIGISSSTSNLNSTMVMKLNPMRHDFSYNIDGTVELKIEYAGVIETLLAQPNEFDIFKTPKHLVNEYVTEFAAIAFKNACGGKSANELRKTLASVGNKSKANRVKTLNDTLRARGKIYYINITPEVLNAWNTIFNQKNRNDTGNPAADTMQDSSGINEAHSVIQKALGSKIPTPSMEESATSSLQYPSNITGVQQLQAQAQEMQGDMEEKKPQESAIRDCAIDPNSNQIAFFYVSDLINLILENISDTFNRTEIHNATTAALEIIQQEIKPTGLDAPANTAAAFTGAVLGEIDDDSFDEMIQFEDQQLAEANYFKNLRVVLGPMYVRDYFSPSEVVCSIGDIPISLRHFNEWLSKQMAKKSKYPLKSFLDDFIKEYLVIYLKGNPFYGDKGILGRSYAFGMQGLSGFDRKYKDEELDTDPLTLLRRTHPKAAGRKSLILLNNLIEPDHRPLINMRSNAILTKNKTKIYDYLVCYQNDASFAIFPEIDEIARLAGIGEFELAQRGIGTYFHGRDRGILKDIQYSRTDIAGLKGSLIAESGLNNADGLHTFREVFSAKLTTFANLDVFPGDYIFIDPESVNTYLDKQTLEDIGNLGTQYLGVGGFFTVRSVSHFFEQGKFETVIDTIFSRTANSQYADVKSMLTEKVAKTIQSPDNAEIVAEREKQCKLVLRQLEKSESETQSRAAGVVENFLEYFSELATALYKAVFDNSDSELSDNDVTSAAGSSEINTINNPDKGSEIAANNGPTN